NQECQIISASVVARALAKAEERFEADALRPRILDDDRSLALRAAVWADPGNADVRAVYADCLLDRDDPRGQLVALQLAAPAGERAARLVELSGADCAQPLTPHLRLGYTLRGGFVAECAVGDDLPADMVAHPAWATVTAIETDNFALL